MIDVQGLTRDFGVFRAVDNVSFSVPKGQVLGFLGPNGAGKSTTMKMLTCFIAPSAGTAKVDGYDICADPIKVKQRIGYLPESASSYGEMTASEFLEFVAEIRGFSGAEKTKAADRVQEVCFLKDVWHQPIETLSKGYRQRVGFAQALIHDPEILVLDEPTDGLDPNQKHEMRRLISTMGESGKTIILSTHILEEVEAVCQRVVIIATGSLVADATPAQLAEKSSLHNAVTISLSGDSLQAAESALEAQAFVDKIEVVDRDSRTLRIFPKDGRSILSEVSGIVREKDWGLQQIHVEHGRLDEVFRKVTIEQDGNLVNPH